MKQINSCDLCGNKNLKFLFKSQDRMYNIKKDYSLYQCKRCGLIFINPRPNDKELLIHYPKNEYYSLNKESDKSELKNLLQKVFYSKKNYFLKLLFLPLKPLLNSTKIVKQGRFLDVGCGAGDFLLLMKSFDMDCYGVEPGDFNKKFARQNGLKIFNGNLKEANYPEDYFDVITLNHVFEHLNNPAETLRELSRILKPDGTLIIGIPKSDCLAYKLFGKYWVALDIPRHVFTYSTTTIKKYAEKTGFKIKKTRHNSSPLQFIGSFLYWTNKYQKKPISLNNILKKKFLVIFLYLVVMPIAYLCNILEIGDQLEIILQPNIKQKT